MRRRKNLISGQDLWPQAFKLSPKDEKELTGKRAKRILGKENSFLYFFFLFFIRYISRQICLEVKTKVFKNILVWLWLCPTHWYGHSSSKSPPLISESPGYILQSRPRVPYRYRISTPSWTDNILRCSWFKLTNWNSQYM